MVAPAAILAATTAIQATTALAALALPAVAPEVARDLGVPTSLVGTYISLLYVGASASALAGGGLVRRAGAIRLSQACLLLAGAGLLLSLVPWVGVVALGAIVLGCGYGPITPASNHLLAHNAPSAHQALFLSIRQSGVPAGTALAGLLVPPLALAAGWRGALAAVALVCAAMVLVAQPLRRQLDADRDRGARISLTQVAAGLELVAQVPTLRVLAAVSFVYAGMQMCATAFVVAYLGDELGWSLVAAGTALTAASLAGVVARIVWGAVADRWLTPHATLTWLGALMAAASLALAAARPDWAATGVLAICAMLGATAIGWNGVYMAEIVRVAPQGRAAVATGGCLFFTFVGVVFLPFLFGALQRATGSYAYCFVAASALCGAAVLLLATRRPRNEAPGAD